MTFAKKRPQVFDFADYRLDIWFLQIDAGAIGLRQFYDSNSKLRSSRNRDSAPFGIQHRQNQQVHDGGCRQTTQNHGTLSPEVIMILRNLQLALRSPTLTVSESST